MTISTQCLICRHYTGFSTCDAFPEKIPQEIFDGTVDHTEPYPGDNGIRFEEIKKRGVEKMIEIDITSLTKAKQRVKVKQTATRKAHYRTQEVGRKEPEPAKKKSPREGTGRIASLPDKMRDDILELRWAGFSGADIKEHIENAFDADPDLRDKFAETGILRIKAGAASLNLASQSLVDWAKARGVESGVKRRTAKSVAAEAKESEEKQFKDANERLARAKTENKTLKDDLEREKKSRKGSEEIRDKLRSDNYILREKLKTC